MTLRDRIVEFKRVRAGDILPHPKNWRTHDDPQREVYARIVEEIGFAGALMVFTTDDDQLMMIDGHLRQDVHPDEMLPTLITDLTADEAEQVLATYDPISGLAGIHLEKMQALFDDMEEAAARHKKALRRVDPPDDPGAQVDRADELREKWQTERGQLWVIASKTGDGEHRILCGDSTDADDVARLMDGRKVDAVVTDPPYGIGWDTDYTRFSTKYQSASRVNYAPIENDNEPFDPRPYLDYPQVVLFGANWYCRHIPIGSWAVWDKRHPSGESFLSDAELAWIKGGKGIYIYAETVQGAHRKERAMHPTQKPVGLIQWCFNRAKIGDTSMILDPFLGSGTTLVACEQTGRIGYGMEIAPEYVAVALERLAGLGLEPRLSNKA